MFRRRRSADDGFDDAAKDESGEDEPFTDVSLAEVGPWDAEQPYPARDRFDFGSLLVPLGPEYKAHLIMADEQHGVCVIIQYGESEMQLQAFAAPKQGSLWDELRTGTAQEINEAGGEAQETVGPFGTELVARVPAPAEHAVSGSLVVRIIGVDGPRWFLRGTFTGPAAGGGEAASLLEEIFRDVVVVRGGHAVPPKEILELRLPQEVQQGIEEQAAAAGEENRFRGDLNPFERGPEFTETR